MGWTLLERNYRVARGPSRRGAEIDLIMREPEGTVVFIEVRQRRARGAWGRGDHRLPIDEAETAKAHRG